MNEGYIKVFRKMVDWEWIGCPEMVAMWINLLLRAAHEDTDCHGVTIRRGQLLTSRRILARQTGLSERQVRTCLSRLKTTHEVTIETTEQPTQRATIITLCRFEDYQDKRPSNRPSERPSNRPTKRPQNDPYNKEDKKETSILTNVRIEVKKDSSDKFVKFQDWISRHAPAVAAMRQPFTEEEFKKIMSSYPAEVVSDVLEGMDNWTKLPLRVSAYKTCLSWLKRREGEVRPAPRKSKIAEAFEEMIKTGSDPESTERLI